LIAGFTGTQQRVTYTCVGDNVNLLEAHTKVLGLPTLIDENTCARLSDGIRVESHGQAQDQEPGCAGLLSSRRTEAMIGCKAWHRTAAVRRVRNTGILPGGGV
jgi:hypothetical protein